MPLLNIDVTTIVELVYNSARDITGKAITNLVG